MFSQKHKNLLILQAAMLLKSSAGLNPLPKKLNEQQEKARIDAFEKTISMTLRNEDTYIPQVLDEIILEYLEKTEKDNQEVTTND